MNIISFSQRSVAARFYAALTIVSLVLSAFPVAFFVAEATVADPAGTLNTIDTPFTNPTGKIQVCHWDAELQAFANDDQEVNVSSAVKGTGHGGHDLDIIPPFWHQLDDQDPKFYPGLNWDDEGKETYDDDCSIPPLTGSISGAKYDDSDNDNSIEGESKISGWEIRLYEVDTPWVLVGTQTTDGDGNYSFTDVPEGSYKVCEVMQDDWTQTFVSNGSTNESPNVSEEGPECRTVNIDENGEQNTVNFGNHYEEPVVDVCPNLDEVQSEVPKGYELVDDVCVPVETPVCLIGEDLLANGSFEEPVVTNGSLWQKFASVTGWLIQKVSDDSATTLELHRGWSGNAAAQGEQYAELDGDHSTKVSQTVATQIGGEYELSWAFAPRHNIAAEQNQLSVLINGSEVATEGPATAAAGLLPGDWTQNSYVFTATGEMTDITFADAGPSNSFGTFLDDARLCLVKEPAPEPEAPEVCSFAGTVVDYSDPAYKNNNDPVDANRRIVEAVETVAPYINFFGKEGNSWNVNPLDFFSLGIGGELVYEFTEKVAVDQPGNDIAIWEITGGAANEQTDEKVQVSVSQNGVDFVFVETITGDGAIDISGTGLDYVRFVKLVDDSAGVQGANGDGYDVDAITIIDGSCRDIPPEPTLCTVTLTSDDTNTVVEKGGAFAKILSFIHPNWTEELTFADWIWGDDGPTDPVNAETQTFVNQFGWAGDVLTDATLVIAADNNFSADLNGSLAGEDFGGGNFGATKSYDVTSLIQSGNNELIVEVANLAQANGTPTSNPAGLYYELVINGEGENCEVPYVPEPEYAPYCGDQEINQEWEQCEVGDEGCTEYCLFDNQCSYEQLVKITLDEDAPESVSFDGGIYLGGADAWVPNGTWFNFNEIGDDIVTDTANNAEGLAVERTDSELRLAVKGGNANGKLDYAFGNIMTLGIDLGAVNRAPIPNWPLENSGDYRDVVTTDDDAETAEFKLYLTTGDDAFTIGINEGEKFNCDDCKAEVEARVILQDGEEIFNGGEGNLSPVVILGDGSEVAFGEWFPVSVAPAMGESAVWIDDAETASNFSNPDDKDGLFVSREGDGTLKVVLYGFHNPGGDTNYESLRATIEFNDATILGGSTVGMFGDYKLENHPENDAVNSNDNFDSFSEHGDLTAVDFDFWVDTKADGITITLGEVAVCDDDTDPDPEDPDTYVIDGYKFEKGDDYIGFLAGWMIYAFNAETETLLATTTDQNGYYYFVVEAGEWEVYEGIDEGWEQVDVHQNGESLVEEQEDQDLYCYFEISDMPEEYIYFQIIDEQQYEEEEGYSCDFYNQRLEDDDDDDDDNPPPTITEERRSGGGGTRRLTPTPQVLGATTCTFLEDYMQIGLENDPFEVTKLQMFLSMIMGYEMPITGVFDRLTDANVKLFQERYRDEVLDPWFARGIVPHDQPTGYVYKTTRWKINDIVCPGWEPYPSFDGENLTFNIDLD